MALSSSSSLLLALTLIACSTQSSVMLVQAQVDDTSLSLDWSSPTHSMYPTYPTYPFGAEEDGEDPEVFGDDSSTKDTRRSLFWHRMRYYISYGALSANRVPCPPRSGRSYYTHNCYRARGPVHPYSRGCSAITRCRR